MIEATTTFALAPLHVSIDYLTARVTTCERKKGDKSEALSFKDKVAKQKKDIDYPKSTDFTSLLEAANDLETIDTLEITSPTTREVHREDARIDVLDAETDEELIET